jgi:hypothetical protein
MKKIALAAKIVLYVLLSLSVILTSLMLFGGTEGDINQTPVYTDLIIRYAYVLIVVGIGSILVFEIINLIMHPSNTKKSMISVALIAAVVGIAYSLSDGTPLEIVAYDGNENIPSMLILTDTGLYSFYILMGIAVIAIIGTELYRMFK